MKVKRVPEGVVLLKRKHSAMHKASETSAKLLCVLCRLNGNAQQHKLTVA
jgi:cytochrome c